MVMGLSKKVLIPILALNTIVAVPPPAIPIRGCDEETPLSEMKARTYNNWREPKL
jgi:hypothetical protein